MNTTPQNSNSRGFTLVELLSITVIIAFIATISSVVILRQAEDGKDIKAFILGDHIAIGSEFFLEEEFTYPYSKGNNAPEDDESYISGGKDPSAKVVSNLIGKNSSINKKNRNYLIEMEITKDGKGGLTRASLQGSQQSGNFNNNATIDAITDPWGNPYLMIYDHSGDRVVEASNDNFLQDYKREVWSPANIVIISAGRDGLFNKKDDIVVIR